MKTMILANWKDGLYEVKESFPFIPRVGEVIHCGDNDGSSYEITITSVTYTNLLQYGKNAGNCGDWLVFLEADVTGNDGAFEDKEEIDNAITARTG